jgi:antibiotic biosynthesis monooxygenase (ABM) superfamily enzyme
MKHPLPITIWITRTVKPGREADFERAIHEFVQRSLSMPGQFGVNIIRPVPGSGSREYRIVRKFADRAAVTTFRNSAGYAAWRLETQDLTEGEPRFEELSGLESWFTPAGAALRPFPQWKLALVTFVGVYPLTSLLPPFFTKMLPAWHPLLVNVLVTALIVIALTWAIMPVLTRAFHAWLTKDLKQVAP